MTRKKKKLTTPVSALRHYSQPLHHPIEFVMTIGDTHIYGGSIYELSTLADVSLVVDLSRTNHNIDSAVTGNAKAADLCPGLFLSQPPTLRINWEDCSTPPLSELWWGNLLQVIQALPSVSRVAVCCVGGSGRTGTALTILAGLAGLIEPEEDPVLWLRKRYHDGAVETGSQMNYIEEITGLMTDAKPAPMALGLTQGWHDMPGIVEPKR